MPGSADVEPATYLVMDMGGHNMVVDRAAITRGFAFGLLASLILLGVYFSVLTLVSGWDFLVDQFSRFWYFVLVLAIGFGVQVGLYVYLRRLVLRPQGSGKVVAVAGGSSTAAMISCCAHYLVNIAPILGATGLLALIAQYQVQLFWVGLIFNLAGVVYVGRKVVQATRDMAQMGHA